MSLREEMIELERILREAHLLSRLTDLLGAGESCWLVGGVLRNWRLGLPVDDFDLATPGDPSDLARRFAQAVGGTWFLLDGERRQSRVVVKGKGRGEGLCYDFAPLRASDLPGDLRLRDFTVNAMALPLLPDGRCGKLEDPLGGLVDLQAGILRACSDGVLEQDPLRVLKGVRHCAVHRFRPDPKTLALMRAAAPLLGRVAGERIRQELWRLFTVSPVAPALELLEECGLVRELFGEAEEGVGLASGIGLCGRWEAVGSIFRRLDLSGALRREFAFELQDELSRETLLKVAAFLRGYGSRDLPARLAETLRLGGKTTALLQNLSTLDGGKLEELEGLACGSRGQALWAEDLGPGPLEALAFLPLLEGGDPTAAAALIYPLLGHYLHHRVGERIPPLVDGRWMREELGYPEGLGIGEALASLRAEEIAGRVRTTEEARDYLRRREKRD